MSENTLSIKLNIILISLIPLSLIIGPSISLINIILIGLFFIFFYFTDKTLKLPLDKSLIALILIYIYLLFNSFISLDHSLGIHRNVGFFRFIIFFLAINYAFFRINEKKILIFWLVVLTLVLIDSFVELIFGTNLLGYGEEYRNRVVSFFKDEPIVASYLNGFILICFGFLLNNFKNFNNLQKAFFTILILSFLICILLTGERSNAIKIFIGFFILCFMIDFINIRLKLTVASILIVLVSAVVYNSDYLQNRYGGQLFTQLIDSDLRSNFIKNNIYFNHHNSGIEVFKSKPLFGVGNKNYRKATCENLKKKENSKLICSTHPHQIYIEFLSEHGIFGTIILLSLIFYLMFKNLKIIFISRNYIQVGALAYMLISLIPLLPSGSFFNDFNLTLFFINLSILYAVNKKTNIFYNSFKK